MTDDVKRYLRKADHALEVAEDLLKDGHMPRCGQQNLLRHVLRCPGTIKY